MRIEFSKISLGLGWLEATSYGACALRLSDPVLVASQLHGAATGGIGDFFVLLARIVLCWVSLSFARAFLLGRLNTLLKEARPQRTTHYAARPAVS